MEPPAICSHVAFIAHPDVAAGLILKAVAAA
jgi:hypothetical protein